MIDRLVDDGLIIVGGPIGAGNHTAHLVEGEDPRQIRAGLAEDPWAKDNHLAVGSLESWALWLDGRSSARKRDDPDCTVVTYDPPGLGLSSRKDGRAMRPPSKAFDVHARHPGAALR